MIDRFARYAAYLLSQEGSQEFDPAKDYERHIALPEENERLLVTPVIEDALRRNKDMLVGENQ